jgi:hypothetical protein
MNYKYLSAFIIALCLISIFCAHSEQSNITGLSPTEIAALPIGKRPIKKFALIGNYTVSQVYRNNVLLTPSSNQPDDLLVVLMDNGRRPFPKAGDIINFTLNDPAIISNMGETCEWTINHWIIAQARYLHGRPPKTEQGSAAKP